MRVGVHDARTPPKLPSRGCESPQRLGRKRLHNTATVLQYTASRPPRARGDLSGVLPRDLTSDYKPPISTRHSKRERNGLAGFNAPALLIVGHGTRSQRGLEECRELLDLTARRLPQTIVARCFLEFGDPDIATAMHRLALQGVRRVVVMPLVLFEAGHAKSDIPSEARSAAHNWGLELVLASALANHPKIIQLSDRHFRNAVRQANIDSRDVLWVPVGHGSHDAGATDQFHEFTALRQEMTPVGETRAASLSSSDPQLETIIQDIGNSPLNWVVFQPHLLFAGELLERFRRMVNGQDRIGRRQHWTIAEHLGCDEWLAVAVVDRYQQAVEATGVRCERQRR